jgi:hypothetical protein
MNLREGDVVSAVALVVESDTSTAAAAAALPEAVEGAEDVVLEAGDESAEESAEDVTAETEDDEENS